MDVLDGLDEVRLADDDVDAIRYFNGYGAQFHDDLPGSKRFLTRPYISVGAPVAARHVVAQPTRWTPRV